MRQGSPAPGLDAWLDWQQQLNAAEIDLGLDRVRAVGERLGVLSPPVPVINVAGTNGKGSVVAFMEAILSAAGYRTGAYTSPHILRYNERVRIAGREADDARLIDAFEAVESARGDIPLTYFEFGTLAALTTFDRAGVDALLLEVGLGGRLDAVNAVEPDVAVITSIGLDHSDWLGDTLDAVAREKAGIMRGGVPAVLGAADMPPVVEARARELNAPVLQPGGGYRYKRRDAHWWLEHHGEVLDGLPIPALAGDHQMANAAAAVVALRCLDARLPLDAGAIRAGLCRANLPGRCQRLPGDVEWLLDVAHNADAAASLAACLRGLSLHGGRQWALLGAMRRKDPHALLRPLAGLFDGWFPLTLPQADAWPAHELAAAVAASDPDAGIVASGPAAQVLEALGARVRPGDRVVAFGSFHTVELVLSQYRLKG